MFRHSRRLDLYPVSAHLVSRGDGQQRGAAVNHRITGQPMNTGSQHVSTRYSSTDPKFPLLSGV
jgi:hypothetical protein